MAFDISAVNFIHINLLRKRSPPDNTRIGMEATGGYWFAKNPKTGKSSSMHKRLLTYAGTEVRVRESGKWKGQTHMSKRGSEALRTALMQISFTISQNDAHFKAIYEKHINTKRHHKVALSFVAANLIEIICSLWKSGREYSIEKPVAKKAA